MMKNKKPKYGDIGWFTGGMLLVVAIFVLFALDVYAAADTYAVRYGYGETIDSIRSAIFVSGDSVSTDKLIPATDSEGGDSLFWAFTVPVQDTAKHDITLRVYYHGQSIVTEFFEYDPPTIWTYVFPASPVANTMGDSAKGWGATSASSTDTANIKTMMNNNSFVRGDSTQNVVFKSLTLAPGATTDTAFLIRASANAPGIYVLGPATTRHAVEFRGVASSSAALALYGAPSGSGAGLFIRAQAGNAPAIDAQGFGSGAGLRVVGGATGPGFEASGGASSGHGAVFTTQAGNSNGIAATGFGAGNGILLTPGATGNGLYSLGGATSGNAVRLQAQNGNGIGLRIEGHGTAAAISTLGGATSGSGALFVGQGTGHGAQFQSGAGATGNGIQATAASTNGHGFRADGIGTGSGIYSIGGATGHGIETSGGATSGHGIYSVAQTLGSGMSLWGAGTDGAGLYARGSTVGSGHGITGLGYGTGDGIFGWSIARHGIFGVTTDVTGDYAGISARALNHNNAIIIGALGTGLILGTIDSTDKIPAVSATISEADIDSIAVAVGDTITSAHGSGSYTSSSGDGVYAVKYYASDTLNDAYIEGTVIDLFNSGGSRISTLTTGSGGFVTWGVVENDVYTTAARGPILYSWETLDTFTANVATDSIMGAKASPVSPTTGKTATVSVIVKKSTGELAVGVKVTAYLAGSNLVDSSGAAISNRAVTVMTNASGVATFQCLWSSYIIPETKWWFAVRAPGIGGQKTDVTVPRQSTYTVTMAN